MTTTAEPLPLTERQAEVLRFIRDNAGYFAPSIREIAAGLQIKNHNAVVGHLAALERHGLIRRRQKVARGIEVLRD